MKSALRLATSLSLVLAAGLAQAYTKSDVKETFVFTGPDRVAADVLDLKGGKALVRVRGVEGVFSGKVLLHKKQYDHDKNPRYTTQYRGRGWNTLSRGKSWGRYSWTIYVPGIRDGIHVALDEKAGKKLDVGKLLALQQRQDKSGELRAIMVFNRKREQKENDEVLAKELKRVRAKCGGAPAFTIDWSKVSDDDIKSYSIGSYCGAAAEAMVRICGKGKAAAAAIRSAVRSVTCKWRGKTGMREPKLTLAGGKGIWIVAGDSGNAADHAAKALESASASDGSSVGRSAAMAAAAVCLGEGDKAVLVGPSEGEFAGIAIRSGGEFHRVPSPRMLGGGWFLDPFHGNPTFNKSFRGYDLRAFGKIEVDKDKKRCTLSCSGKKIQLKLADEATKMKILRGAKVKDRPFQREPYALARDPRGVYYYVDTAAGKNARDYRLFLGRKGKLRPVKIKDASSDSEGLSLTTARGTFQVGRWNAQWTVGKKKPTGLQVLPIGSNGKLIFAELGVYKIKKLGTPCD